MLVCSLVIEDLPEGNLQGVCPPDTARLGVVLVQGDARGKVDATHHHAGIRMIGIIRRIGGVIHHQGDDIRLTGERIRLKGRGTPQSEGESLLKERGILPIEGATLQTGEDTRLIWEEGAGHQFEEVPLEGMTPLDGTPLKGGHPHLDEVIRWKREHRQIERL